MGNGLFGESLLVRKMGDVVGLEGLGAKRSIPSAARVRATMTSRATWLGVATFAPRRRRSSRSRGGLERDVVEEDVGVLLEEAGEFAQAILPGGAVDHQSGRRWKQLSRGFFGGEVRGAVSSLREPAARS